MRKPAWPLKPRPSTNEGVSEVKRLLRSRSLNTVCEEARCPNLSECFSQGTATFMILGDICTRGCRFCAVHTGRPRMEVAEFEREAQRIAEAASQLMLRHVVITSVARDDLKDGGASGFVACIRELRRSLPSATVEVLIPDFRGSHESLDHVLDAAPDVLNHNIETVPRLYRRVRPGASYRRSFELLKRASRRGEGVRTKTGIMLGLGETKPEIMDVFRDAVDSGVSIFTAGQYLQPTRDHLPVEEYVPPEMFAELESEARAVGIEECFFGPFVRSSYHAGEFVEPLSPRKAMGV